MTAKIAATRRCGLARGPGCHAAGFGTREEARRMRAQQGMEGGVLGPMSAIARPATGQLAGGRRGRKSSAVHDREDRRHETVRSRARPGLGLQLDMDFLRAADARDA